MPDPIVVADVQPAASSAAPDPTPVPTADLDTMSETELRDWRLTGALPSPSPVTAPPADPPPAEPVEQAASTDAPIVAASEPAEPELPAKTKARMAELLADRAKERDRAERAEQRARDLEARHAPPPPDARPAASSAAPAGLVKPNPETFPYGTADPDYLEALTAYKVAATLQTERATWEQAQAQARAIEEQQRVLTAFNERLEAARAAHPPEWIAVALGPTEIPQGGVADLFILEDPAGAEVLGHLQQPAHAGERRRILKLGPLDQIKELVRLGDRLAAGPAVPRSTNAPAPAPVLGSRATPADPVQRAIDADDTAAYNAEMNRRDLARLKPR